MVAHHPFAFRIRPSRFSSFPLSLSFSLGLLCVFSILLFVFFLLVLHTFLCLLCLLSDDQSFRQQASESFRQAMKYRCACAHTIRDFASSERRGKNARKDEEPKRRVCRVTLVFTVDISTWPLSWMSHVSSLPLTGLAFHLPWRSCFDNTLFSLSASREQSMPVC